ncbi:phosphatidylserine synthase 2 [Strigomonas culicis]|uniref:Phosphatidylserine synthase 2 n=1 Tax=Strigomonas culicis TaxID=28005 RepID=S9WEL0_9TRYP|nr:phosphatidylserine synthase 2 [Strigomonas culicis]EPY34125.1 phosphatidylserine synthase 2 [Strigomonas culicis]|eukprot:EPY26341.1 phosphatidylserine synthase 2 [Strigomonas culicis]
MKASSPKPPKAKKGAASEAAEKRPLSSGEPRQPTARKGRSADAKLVSPSPWARELDFDDLIYTPHTVFALLTMVMAILLGLRYYYYPTMDVVANVKVGLAAAAFTFIGFGALHLPDSLLVRPHPAVWRAVLAVGIMYIVLLTFLLFQDLGTIRQMLGYCDPALLEPMPEREYAADCRMYTDEDPFVFLKNFDSFIIAHALGYVVKALIMRDWRMVTCISLGFEVLEITFQHILPNFRECWWDHLILDVLVCNTGGTLLGLALLRQLKAKQYHWIALREIRGVKGKAQRVLTQFSPRSFEIYHWDAFVSLKRFLQVVGILALMFVQELNCFTMKAILPMSHTHPIVLGRLLLWALMAMPGLREYYEFMSNPAVKRIGTTAWVTTFGLVLESIFIVKMRYEGQYFQEAMPSYIALPWMAALALFLVWMLLYFGLLSKRQREARRGVLYLLTNLFFFGAAFCILALFLMGLPDLQVGRSEFERIVAPYEQRILFWRS